MFTECVRWFMLYIKNVNLLGNGVIWSREQLKNGIFLVFSASNDFFVKA